MKNMTGYSLRRFAAYLVNGLIIIVPLAVTVWVIIWLFDIVDGLLTPILNWAFGRHIPGMGFVIVVALVVLIGYIGFKIRQRKAFGTIEARIIKIPFLGTIYGFTRQILDNFTTTSSEKFLGVVFMEFPPPGHFLTGASDRPVQGQGRQQDAKRIYSHCPEPCHRLLANRAGITGYSDDYERE